VGRALSFSIVAHLAFVLSFLLLSSARKPLVIPQVARPVRLVTYLEPAAAPRPRTAAPVVADPRLAPAAPARAETQKTIPAPARNESRVAQPNQAPAKAPPAAARVSPVAIPKVPALEIPNAHRTPTPPAKEQPDVTQKILSKWDARPATVTPSITETPPPLAKAHVPKQDATVSGEAPDYPQPSPPPSDAVRDPILAPYVENLSGRIYAHWFPPSEFFQKGRSPVALVSFRVDRAGKLSSITLKEGSGFNRFDQSAMVAVRALGQAPPLPEQYREETLDVVINFQKQVQQ
jgi:TonB family protein